MCALSDVCLIHSHRGLNRPDVAGKPQRGVNALQAAWVHGSAGCLRVGIPARELTQALGASKCLTAGRVTSIGAVANRSERKSAELGMVCMLGRSVEPLLCLCKRVGMLSGLDREYDAWRENCDAVDLPAMRHGVNLEVEEGRSSAMPAETDTRAHRARMQVWLPCACCQLHRHGVRTEGIAAGLHCLPPHRIARVANGQVWQRASQYRDQNKAMFAGGAVKRQSKSVLWLTRSRVAPLRAKSAVLQVRHRDSRKSRSKLTSR